MIKYKLFLKNPASHYIYVDLVIDGVSENTLTLQLPAWRPGRYELGNFAKNIKRVDVFDKNNKPLAFEKTSKDAWVIQTKGVDEIKVTYSYYAAELNAGACYADENQLYVNPVHLCMYLPNRLHELHEIHLDIPDDYKIACSLPVKNKTLSAQSFDELADSPFIASPHIKTDSYEVKGIKFYLHFNGECRPDFEKIKTHFTSFTKKQIEFWEDIPVNEYHFLFQITPYRFYHGVEHLKSTVIALGPGYALNEGKVYEDLLGVSSHELFHTWNIKYIRPVEMLPYDFSKENYSRTGYVYEGFTTYYGDLLLRSAGVFNNEQYFETLEERLQKHFHNYGRYNLPVAQSSWDTWLDGYVPGAPYRKTSIYDEGNLIAFMLDILILKHSNNTNSLRDVCRILYNNFGKKNKGYSEEKLITLCEKTAGTSLRSFFNKYIYGTEDFEPQLQECFNYLGIKLKKNPSLFLNESAFGFKTNDVATTTKVSLVAPYSPSWKAGIAINDEIISVNDYQIKNDLNNWLNYFKNAELKLVVIRAGKLKTININKSEKAITYFDNYKLEFLQNSDKLQNEAFAKWIS